MASLTAQANNHLRSNSFSTEARHSFSKAS
jgi:hypothetical protein